MVARFVNGKSVRGILIYNENKVKAGEAHLLLANGFATEVTALNLNEKLKRFEHLTNLNERVKTNAIHISLNFDPRDKVNNSQLQQIVTTYMEMIGFGEQPFLVYRHSDAAHEHVHIATVNIKRDGTRIDTHGIGWKVSEAARKEIEKQFGLVPAQGRNLSNSLSIRPADIEKAQYGLTPTKMAITNVVNAVISSYKFTSLAEFNAVLKQYNVLATRGHQETLMYKNNGLIYTLVDDKGQNVGVPIKSSSLYNKPTLQKLEKHFERNIEKRKELKSPLKRIIDTVLNKGGRISKNTFLTDLKSRNVEAVFRVNEQGVTYGVTFVDNNNKVVFNGSDLGKEYSAKSILHKLNIEKKHSIDIQLKPKQERRAKPGVERLMPATLSKPSNDPFLPLALAKYCPQAAPQTPKKKKRRRAKEQSQDQGQSL